MPWISGVWGEGRKPGLNKMGGRAAMHASAKTRTGSCTSIIGAFHVPLKNAAVRRLFGALEASLDIACSHDDVGSGQDMVSALSG